MWFENQSFAWVIYGQKLIEKRENWMESNCWKHLIGFLEIMPFWCTNCLRNLLFFHRIILLFFKWYIADRFLTRLGVGKLNFKIILFNLFSSAFRTQNFNLTASLQSIFLSNAHPLQFPQNDYQNFQNEKVNLRRVTSKPVNKSTEQTKTCNFSAK